MSTKQLLKTTAVAIVAGLLMMVPMTSQAQETFKVGNSQYVTTSASTVAFKVHKGEAASFRIPSRVTYNGKSYIVNEAIDIEIKDKIGTFIIPKTLKKITFTNNSVSYNSLSYHVGRFVVEQENPCFTVTNGMLIDKVNKVLVACPYTKKGSLTIPPGIRRIEKCAFTWCEELEAVNMPNSIEDIGSNAFSHCIKLKSVKLSNKLERIGRSAFYRCKSLSNISLPNGLKSIQKYAFLSCESLESIVIPDDIFIGAGAFRACTSLKDVSLPLDFYLEPEDGSVLVFYDTPYGKRNPNPKPDAQRVSPNSMSWPEPTRNDSWKNYGSFSHKGVRWDNNMLMFIKYEHDWNSYEVTADTPGKSFGTLVGKYDNYKDAEAAAYFYSVYRLTRTRGKN